MSDKKEVKSDPDEGYKFNKESDKPRIGEDDNEKPRRDEDEKQSVGSDNCAGEKKECADEGKKDKEV